MATRLYYPTSVGRNPADLDLKGYSRLGERLLVEGFRELRCNGVDPVDVALRHTHDLGHGIPRQLPSGRLDLSADHDGGVFSPADISSDIRSCTASTVKAGFCRGCPMPSPRPRSSASACCGRLAAYPVDGIALLFNRRPPYLDYEAPLVESFKREFGEDPHDLDERDPRWLAHRAAVLTAFMRRLRAEMDAASAARNGKRHRHLGLRAGHPGRQRLLRLGRGHLGA